MKFDISGELETSVSGRPYCVGPISRNVSLSRCWSIWSTTNCLTSVPSEYDLGMNNYTEPVFSDNLIGWEAAEAYYHAQELADEAYRKRMGIVREIAEEI